MDTQIVYIVVSTPQDFFLEELWASLYSLRQFHPEARVVVLTDEPTATRINASTYQQLRSMMTELKTVPVTKEYDGKQRSRVLKTNIRNLIDGDFIFIDTDTIITASLEEIDNLDIKNLAMVPDIHLHSFVKERTDLLSVPIIIENVYGTDANDLPIYFNSGVSLVRDNALTRKFFTKWHENWLISLSKGIDTDQQALAYTNHCFGNVIELMPDVYNCQLMYGAKYLQEAKILHIYRNPQLCMGDYPTRHLWNIYPKIRQEGKLTDEMAAVLMAAKSQLSASSCIVSFEDVNFLRSKFYKFYKLNKFHLRWFVDIFNRWAALRESKRKMKSL